MCPICQFKAYDDHPGDMKKHIMFEHDKEESWAKDNMIVDVSEKLKRFRKLTTKEVVRLDGRKVNTFEGVEKVTILVTAPAIRASFTPTSPTYLICGVAGCDKLCESVYKLKIHYERHDVSLQRERFECVLCPAVEDKVKKMRRHVEKDHPEVRAQNEPSRSLKLYNHMGLLRSYTTSKLRECSFQALPEVLFLVEAGEEQWRVVRSEKWRRFSEEVDNIVESAGGKRRHEEEQEEFETVHMTCSYCTLTFNTRCVWIIILSQIFFPDTTITYLESPTWTTRRCTSRSWRSSRVRSVGRCSWWRASTWRTSAATARPTPAPSSAASAVTAAASTSGIELETNLREV